MELINANDVGRVHEVLVGGEWIPVTIGSYWQHNDPQANSSSFYTPPPNRPGQAGWREFNNGALVLVRIEAVMGFKFDTLRGKLEGH